ncbi:urate hydroxylase PuuD [Massilia sp. W12]|uniref:urate hydroxylase PuuD n=1 Tax=Massilia sp. W12 TaxID=3126507 RepID=UPI0030CFD991
MDISLTPYFLDWANLLLRWLHLITGIAWIGASFYFVWLDNSLRPPAPGSDLAAKGVSGHLWAVHGGGFYNPQKYLVSPPELPQELHWFKWEAYATWLSGMALMCVAYYAHADTMLLDKAVADLSPLQGIGIGLGALVLAWAVYDGLCRTRLVEKQALFGVTVWLLLIAAGWGLAQFLSARAAFLHVGAMIGTIMAGNVLMVIIPGQKKLVAALSARQSPDPIYGIRGKQRSVHNNYFTLPLLLIMISNHYPLLWQGRNNWIALALVMAAGVLIRHFFNLRHKGQTVWAWPLAGLVLLGLLAWLAAPAKPQAGAQQVSFAQVQTILQARCVSCHADKPSQPGFAQAPAGISLESPQAIAQHAARIASQVQTRAMPLANLTQMTEQERALVQSWFAQGATVTAKP